jgi:hypothetical protein
MPDENSMINRHIFQDFLTIVTTRTCNSNNSDPINEKPAASINVVIASDADVIDHSPLLLV